MQQHDPPSSAIAVLSWQVDGRIDMNIAVDKKSAKPKNFPRHKPNLGIQSTSTPGIILERLEANGHPRSRDLGASQKGSNGVVNSH